MSTDFTKLKEKLGYKKDNGFLRIDKNEKKQVFDFCDNYRNFITIAKTEREVCTEALKIFKDNGFEALETKKGLKVGDKVYTVNREKGIIAAVIGSDSMINGVNVVGAHIDSPRLDLKPRPLYEDNGIAFFKTHYYGGIKKYQWTAIPLALHGIVALENGTQMNISIGEDDSDPVFVITDLLPHLATEQMQKKMSEAIGGESLNIILGNISIDDGEIKEGVKLNILNLLHEKYGIIEEDLISSELEIVPAFSARDTGLDRSMIAGYGQDDRVCAYGAIKAILDIQKPKKTAICLLVDKEEIGSMGNTGMQSTQFEDVLAKLIFMTENNYNDIMVRDCLKASTCLSADVGVAFDPNYPEVCEKYNTAILNGGVMITKYTGSRGKGGASDAGAELMARVRKIFND
ncbi:MAG: aminopeptidase, partial [Oscillospiraceae bacterium]